MKRNLILTALAALLTLPASAAQQKLHGHVPPAVAQLHPHQRLDPGTNLTLAIGLSLRNEQDLTNLLEDIYNPSSPNYRHYLTPEQFNERFGPTDQDYQALIGFARSNGLTVVGTHSNRRLLDVRGPVATIEKAFNVRMQVYQHPTEARNFFAPDAEPSVDLNVPVLSVGGLNNFEVPRPAGLHMVKTAANRYRSDYGTGTNGGYMGNDFRAAYAPGVTLTGAGQTVALVEFDGYFPADITQYKTMAGLPNVPVSNVLIDGYDGSAGANNVEVALDIEMAISMAPGLNGVIVYEQGNGVANPDDLLSRIASDNSAKQISASWSYPADAFSDTIFAQFKAQGQTFFNASGDSGAYPTGAIPTPCDDPNITIVGGTTLFTGSPGGPWFSEQVWNWYSSGEGAAGSSGGISTRWTIPAWQQGLDMSSNHGSVFFRNIPDVGMTADNVVVIANNGQTLFPIGGTSVAAPLWAGFMALVNQQSPVPVGFLNPAIYALGKSSRYNIAFHDIIAGNNTNTTVTTNFPAVTGYDLCTGWGSPAGVGLINALALPPGTPYLTLTNATLIAEFCAPTNGVIDPNETVTVSFGLVNLGTGDTTNLVATLQPSGGVTPTNIPATNYYGVVKAGGAPVSNSFTFTASGVCGGTITATLQLQDGATDLGTVSIVLPLGRHIFNQPLLQNFDSVNTPNLPAGWSSSVVGSVIFPWMTTYQVSDTPTNCVWATESGYPGETDLVSPSFPVTNAAAQLSFRHNYITERGYDGGVLDMRIDSGAYMDVIAAGGTFVTGGYDMALVNTNSNPLGGRLAWTGTTLGWITTTINLPAAAVGHNVQFKWRFGTDLGVSDNGWVVDSVAVTEGNYYLCAACSGIVMAAAPPHLINPHVSNGKFIFSFQTESGKSYTVLSKGSQPGAVWQAGQHVNGDGTIKAVTNTLNGAPGLFRVSSP